MSIFGRTKKQRFYFVLFIVGCLSLSAFLALYALRGNIALFYTPSEMRLLLAQDSPAVRPPRVFRIGGLVKEGSVSARGDDLGITFTVTDGAGEAAVAYQGLLPDLFREGQGVVALGLLDDNGVFQARTLLAKHDENYMPPELKDGLARAQDKQRAQETLDGGGAP
jgi:cytochrome c-type biogenesis protein CcmE